MTQITTDLILGIREWLGPDGQQFFKNLKEEHGRVDPCLKIGDVPHPVHFREGMSVRNKMRQLTNYSWTDHEYDDNWVQVIEKAIEE